MLFKFVLAAVSSLLPLGGLERLPPSRIVWIEISWVHARPTFMITVGSQLLGQAVSKLTSPPQVSDHSKGFIFNPMSRKPKVPNPEARGSSI
ncbi:hypothetical protein GCM10007880_64380 [Mesorhizobium amorphae]|nr:hypothetical protein GCM10007880_64380 [Mesorhizobium amorphae]